MLAREMTVELQRTRDTIRRGETRILLAKGIDFGRLTRREDGMWDVRQVTGLPRQSLITATPIDPPSLLVRPWHQAGNSVSLRDFTSTYHHHHHGIQSTERFGAGVDPDGDGFSNEMTRADVAAVTVFQAVMAVPGQVVPNDPEVERAILHGQRLFSALPLPRLAPAQPRDEIMMAQSYTDFKLHDASGEADDMPVESLDVNWPVWAPKFAVGNRRFLTRRLWGIANSGPYF